jgi:mono/diheme cytochrome c family protein
MTRRLLTVCLGNVVFSISLLAALAAEKEKTKIDVSKLPPASTKKGVTYASDIKPIFDKSCVKCHGTEKPKGKLQLNSLEGVLKGGEDGKVIEAGSSAGSVLVHNIAHLGDPDDYMPPPHNKAGIGPLTPEQIGLIRAWIDQGAK